MDNQRERLYTNEDEFDYEINPMIYESTCKAWKKAKMNQNDDYSQCVNDYNRNEDKWKEFKLINGILNNFDGKLNSIKGKYIEKSLILQPFLLLLRVCRRIWSDSEDEVYT